MINARFAAAVVAGLASLTAPSAAADELRIASWNIANLASGPNVDLRGYTRSEEDFIQLRA